MTSRISNLGLVRLARTSSLTAALLFAFAAIASGQALVERMPPMDTPLNSELTALDHYVNQPDSTYAWKIARTIPTEKGTLWVVDLISQTWLRPDEVDRPVWQHWLLVYRPREVKSNRAMMFIGGGSNGGEAPDKMDLRVSMIAEATNTVVCELKMVPNQPLIFHGDGNPRKEDDLIAYTWDHYLKTGDQRWPARLPMVKSVVRAMDTVEALLASPEGGDLKINQFVVAGGSKRGWTTWMTAAVDKRVIAIAPIVIDVLNVDQSMQHHYSSYGFWAPAIGDYVHHKIVDRRNEPRYVELLKIEDPYAYRERLTMPKCIINATGDQFFCPDSSQFYFGDLPGEKHLCYVPNADHSLKGSNALDTLICFYHCVVNDIPRPEVKWSLEPDRIVVRCTQPPRKVTLWQAKNREARDFREEVIGKSYQPTELKPNGDGEYLAVLQKPAEGWEANFVQCEFDVGGPSPLRLSTPVKVLPDLLPAAGK